MAANFHIGELAARTRRSVHAIRWYESQGLVPGVERDRGGRRLYHELHVGWLDLIDRLRRTGMSVAEMRVYVALVRQGRGTLKERKELLDAHRRRVKATIAEYIQALKLIDAKVDFYETWLATGERPKLPAVRKASASPSTRTRRRHRNKDKST